MGVHLFPFRTEKLSPIALMVLPHAGGRVSRRQPEYLNTPQQNLLRGIFLYLSQTFKSIDHSFTIKEIPFFYLSELQTLLPYLKNI